MPKSTGLDLPVRQEQQASSPEVDRHSTTTVVSDTSIFKRWSIFAAILVLFLSSLACRLEFGFGRDESAQTETPTSEIVVSLPPTKEIAAIQPTPLIEDAAQDKVLPAASPTVASPTPLPPAPTASPTINSKLVPTTIAEEDENGVPGEPASTPGIRPTATPIPFIPARYPPEKIIVPAIGVDAPVASAGWVIKEDDGAPTSLWDIPMNAAGWHKNSALPGHGNNVVLSGHHNLGSEVFRNLVDLKVGDEIVLQADAYEYRYQVTDRFIVPERNAPEEQRAQNAQWINPTVDERVTLVTCWPYNDNSHRLIVVAKPTGFNEF